jgi:hypothetical protein
MSDPDAVPPTPDPRCGTYAGYNRHNRLGEDQCGPCRAAATEYVRDWRYRTSRVKARLIGISALDQSLLEAKWSR